MDSRRIPGLVLEEAADVLTHLADWLRAAPSCPWCGSLAGCSHEARCPLRRVPRLRCLLGAGDEKRRDEELTALERERGAMTPRMDGALVAPSGSAAAAVPVQPGTPLADEGGAT
jgi:hypothetical protein